jgi:hypothetical protein
MQIKGLSETLLDAKLGGMYRVEYDRTAPMPWAVWSDGEILGAGYSRVSAIRDALKTAREWRS